MAAKRPTPVVCVTRAGLTAAVAVGLTTVFASRTWLTAGMLAAVAPHALLAWADRRKWSAVASAVALLAGACVITVYATVAFTTSYGVPTGDTFRIYFEDLRDTPEILRTAVVPVPAERGALLLALLALWLTGSVAEWTARRFDATLGAIGPSLVLFVSIAALGEGGWAFVTIVYALAATLYLLALHQSELTERRSWFHTGEPHRSRVLQGGIVAALAVVLLAAVLAPSLPGARSAGWFDYRSLGDGGGGGLLTATTPIVSIQAKLLENPDAEVFTVDIGDARPTYWRVIALDSYDGTLWTLEDSGEPADDLRPPSEPGRFDELVQDFTIAESEPHWLPAAYHPVEINLENALMVESSATVYLKPDDAISDLRYEVTSAIPVFDEGEQLAAPFVDPSDFPRTLALPADFPEEVDALAREVTAGAPTPWERAEALERYLNQTGGFVYNDEVARSHSIDTLEEFLFERREGYCEQFASAFAAMARSVGLPTRIGVGYSYGTARDGAWVVRNRDAHAWPEVYFAGLGWVAFEPTPGRGANAPGGTEDPNVRPDGADAIAPPSATTAPTTAAPGDGPDPSLTIPPGEREGLTAGGSAAEDDDPAHPVVQFVTGLLIVSAVLALFALLGVGVLAIAAMRRTWHRRHATEPRDRVIGAWAQALDHLSEAGVAPKPSATPVEFALRHAPAHGAGDAGPPLMELARLQTAALFAPEPPTTDDADAAWAKVDAIDRVLDHQLSSLRRWRTRLDPRRLRVPLADRRGPTVDGIGA